MVKVKVALEHAMKTHRVNSGKALHFFNQWLSGVDG